MELDLLAKSKSSLTPNKAIKEYLRKMSDDPKFHNSDSEIETSNELKGQKASEKEKKEEENSFELSISADEDNVEEDEEALKDTVIIIGHKHPDTDTITSAIVLADFEAKTGNKNIVVPGRLGKLNKETKFAIKYFGFEKPKFVKNSTAYKEVMMVDHNNFSQSADDIEDANITKIIDHHVISGFDGTNPIHILTEPLGSTCTILYQMYKENNIKIEKNIAGLMLSGIISDTVLFKGPTCTKFDREAAEVLEKLAEVDAQDYGMQMLKRGTDISDIPDKTLITLDSKEMMMKGKKVVISQINSVEVKEVLKRKDGILSEMNKYLEENNLQLFILDILDIIAMDSTAIVIGSEMDVVEKAFKTELKDNVAFLKGVVSRKKDMFPVIKNTLKK